MMNRMESEITALYTRETAASFNDSLTGLFTHGFFLLCLQQEIHRCQRGGPPFCVAIADIDEFSRFVAHHGPIAAERRLKEVAATIRSQTRKGDILARFHGDQFALMFIGGGALEFAAAAERIRKAVDCRSQGAMTVSIGLAPPVRCGMPVDPLAVVRQALSAVRTAKSRGKNRVQAPEPVSVPAPAGRFNILVVDDEPVNRKLMAALLTPLGHEIFTAADGEAALYTLAHAPIDLVLLDVMMPGTDGFEVCRRIKSDEETRMLPVVLVTALDDVASRIRGIEAGADDFINKPANRAELVARVQSLLRLKRLNNNLTSIENVLFSLANSVEAKDSYTQGHVARVSQMALTVGRRMGLGAEDLEALRLGGILHDVGKLGVPETVLNKPGPLDPDEWDLMKRHTEIGYRICLPLKKTLGAALDVIRHHHEKLDGSGYPDGLSGGEISIAARVMAVADIYDALTSERPYRRTMSVARALAILDEEAAAGKLDPQAVGCLAEIVAGRREPAGKGAGDAATQPSALADRPPVIRQTGT